MGHSRLNTSPFDKGVDLFYLLPVRHIMQVAILLLILMVAVQGANVMGMAAARAQSPADGVTTESPSVNSEKTVREDPVCDPSHRPQITKIEPDEFAGGDKVAIIGDFGSKKDCVFDVTFGQDKAKDFNFMGNDKIEATAPDNVAPGMMFVNVITGGGSARSAVLVKKKE